MTDGQAWRAVWVEKTAEGGMALKGLESGAGGAPRELFRAAPEFPGVTRPLLSSDGQTVIFTSGIPESEAAPAEETEPLEEGQEKRRIWQLPWTGGAPRSLGEGMALDVARDPATGQDSVYALETVPAESRRRAGGRHVLRFSLERPEAREIVWTETAVGVDGFQVSADGERAAGLFPWPQAGLANLTDRTFTPLAHGSWPALAPDNSYASWVLDGTRRRLRLFAPNLDPGWELNFAEQTALNGRALMHPRWSNDPRVIVFTAVTPEAEREGGAATGDVFVARLREDLRRVESLHALTNGAAASFPDLWVAGGETRASSLPQRPATVPKEVVKPWPVTTDGLVFAWENKTAAPASGVRFSGPLAPAGFATYGRYFEMDLSAGAFDAPPAAAETLARECAASNAWSVECLLTERRTDAPVSVRLMALDAADGRTAFALYRVDRKLVLRARLDGAQGSPALVYPAVLTHLSIEEDRPVHLLLTLKGNRLGCYVDGQLMKEFLLEASGLSAWAAPGNAAPRLSFGDLEPYGSPWTGMLERVAFYHRALDSREIEEAWETAKKLMEKRKRPSRIRLKAKLLEAPPAAETLQQPLLLASSVWEVQQVNTGSLEHRKIAVLHWTRLNGRPVPSGLPAPGEVTELILEPLEEHPELTGGQGIETLPPSSELPLYFDILPPGRRAAAPPRPQEYEER